MALTDLQQKFVDEYLKCFNATEAARRAGYSATNGSLAVIGWENLRKPNISEEVDRHLEESAMSRCEALMRLGEQARVSMGDFLSIEYEVNDNGDEVEDSDGNKIVVNYGIDIEAVKEKGHLVKSMTWTKYGPKVELHDAQSALEKIGRHHQLFTDNIKIDASDNVLEWLKALRDG